MQVIGEFFHALLEAESKAHMPPQIQWAEEMDTLAQPTEVPDQRSLKFYFPEIAKSQRERGGVQASTLAGTIRMTLPYPFARLRMDAQYLMIYSVREAEVEENHLRIIGAILNSCSRIKDALVTYINGKTGKECKTWCKVNFMDIGDNNFGQATTKAKYVVISCARSKVEEVKMLMREYFLLNATYQ
jgi:hypothetical protein